MVTTQSRPLLALIVGTPKRHERIRCSISSSSNGIYILETVGITCSGCLAEFLKKQDDATNYSTFSIPLFFLDLRVFSIGFAVLSRYFLVEVFNMWVLERVGDLNDS